MLARQPYTVMHPESPGMHLTVHRRPILAWLYPRDFATLGEACRHAWGALHATTPAQRTANMLDTTQPPALEDREDCPNCQRKPTTTRSAGGSEKTACTGCGLAVSASNGDSITPWNKLVACIGGSGTTG